jgi:hypothetical protein
MIEFYCGCRIGSRGARCKNRCTCATLVALAEAGWHLEQTWEYGAGCCKFYCPSCAPICCDKSNNLLAALLPQQPMTINGIEHWLNKDTPKMVPLSELSHRAVLEPLSDYQRVRKVDIVRAVEAKAQSMMERMTERMTGRESLHPAPTIRERMMGVRAAVPSEDEADTPVTVPVSPEPK